MINMEEILSTEDVEVKAWYRQIEHNDILYYVTNIDTRNSIVYVLCRRKLDPVGEFISYEFPLLKFVNMVVRFASMDGEQS